MPFSYLPVMIPHARGDHETTPTPVIQEIVEQQDFCKSSSLSLESYTYLSYGKVLVAEFQLYPSGRNDTLPAHRLVVLN